MDDSDATHQSLVQSSRRVQKQLAGFATLVLTTAIFGVLMPILLLLAPVATWLNLQAMHWIVRHSEEVPFGELLAERILVQSPTYMLRNFSYALNSVVMIFVLVDMEFDLSPIVLYCVAIVVLVIVMALLHDHWKSKDKQARRARATMDVVYAAPLHSQVIDLDQVHDKLEGDDHLGDVQVTPNPMIKSPSAVLSL